VAEKKMDRTLLWQEMEAEAEALEKRALDQEKTEETGAENEKEELPVWDGEAGFADLMARMNQGQRAAAPGADEIEDEEKDVASAAPADGKRVIRWRMVAVLAAVLILTLILGVGTFGEKVYTPKSVTELKDGEVVIWINNDEMIVRDVNEEEIYQEIEERLGILALRLGYKPAGMELYKVELREEYGDVRIEYLYEGDIWTVYMSRNYSETDICMECDGEKIVKSSVENFWFQQELEVLELEVQEGCKTFLIELKEGTAAYVLMGADNYEEFEKIIQEIYIKNA